MKPIHPNRNGVYRQAQPFKGAHEGSDRPRVRRRPLLRLVADTGGVLQDRHPLK